MRKFFKMMDCPECEMSDAEKADLKLAMLLNPFVRNAVIKKFEATYEEQPAALMASAGLASVKFTGIDWENFDWEAAKDFWVEILKVVIEIIMVFV